ncbi:hypothetical protein H310_06693 [Aphanomyces invadans]|uniref:PX domain-containing protein n=1 Tax=Aphanomyces invadans TaxID=157072 RepID=A0A024U3S3_9STRA|nr:hypothetical protein H310_06693 [Aphanomyces invadans]ETW01066.1 hypothetical protein H310_06693 [Aphanomyces invadans]|eukprot:XP_008870064.1 hypothetical protein H310_06693 [Aphanomyces invadans]
MEAEHYCPSTSISCTTSTSGGSTSSSPMHPLYDRRPRPSRSTTYVFQVACTETKTKWTLRRSYMDFVVLHSQLVRVHGTSRRHPAMQALLASIVDIELSTLGSTRDFYQQLQEFAGSLAAMRLDCTALASVPCLQENLLFRANRVYVLLTAFLQVPTSQVREELRCVVSTAYGRHDVIDRLLEQLDVASPMYLLLDLNDIFHLRQLKRTSTATGRCHRVC